MIVRALVLRPVLRETLRTALTILGIAVGVSVIVAIALSNQSALRAFRESVDAVAGKANYQIVSDAGIDESLLIALQPFWAEGLRVAPVIDTDGIAEPWETPVRLLGVDLLSDLHFRDYRYASVVTSGGQSVATYLSLFRDDSVVVPASFASAHSLRLGSPLTISVGGIRRTMTVRGLLQSRGPATAFNGALVIADIAVVQSSFAMAGRLTRIDLIVPDEKLAARIASVMPSNARLERPSRRNERVEKMLRAFRVNLFALAGVALLVGMFLVYNTVLISILRRRKDVGVFKTLGASPGQIFRAFLMEGLVFGVAGAAIGILLGWGLAFGILRLIGRTINALYVSSAPEAIALTPGIVAVGFAVGILLSLLSSIQPSIEAAQVRPNLLIRPGLQQRMTRSRNGMLVTVAAGCFVLAALFCQLPAFSGIAAGGYVAVLFVVMGFSALAPIFVRLGAGLMRVPFRRGFGVVGELASASIPASLRRTSIASAALSLAIGMMVAVALMVGSFRETVRIWVDQTVSSDLWLRPARGLTNAQTALFSDAILADLARVPFLAAIDPVRGRDIAYQDGIVSVGSGDFAIAARYGHLPMIEPSSARAAIEESLARQGVVVSESFSLKYGKGRGSRVRLPVVGGTRWFPVTGVYRDYSNDRGVIVMDRALYVRSFQDHAINTIILYLKPGVRAEEARSRLEAMFGPKYHAFAVTNGEIRGEVMKIFDQTFLITYALLGVAIAVAVLGIVNTLSALILERSRELGVLRVLGLSLAELRRMLILESSLLGLTSTVAGLVMGYVLSWILIFVINKQSFGWTIEFHTPVRLIAASLAVTFLASVAAGLFPSALAARIDLAAAIKSE